MLEESCRCRDEFALANDTMIGVGAYPYQDCEKRLLESQWEAEGTIFAYERQIAGPS
jgi:S-adenosylmethionine synthetase